MSDLASSVHLKVEQDDVIMEKLLLRGMCFVGATTQM